MVQSEPWDLSNNFNIVFVNNFFIYSYGAYMENCKCCASLSKILLYICAQ